MEILLDTADMKAIKEAIEFYPVNGFTTNPSILSKAGEEVGEIMKEFKKILKPEQTIHIQTTAVTAVDMVVQAKILTDYLGTNLHVKLPMTSEGIKAVQLAKAEGLKVTVTAVFTAVQGFLAAKAGADYVAPYVNRIDNISGNGIQVVKNLISILANYNYNTKILGASFKNVQQIEELAIAGCQAVTITPDLIDTFVNHPYTVKSLVDFETDWKRSFGTNQVTDLLRLDKSGKLY